MIMLKQDQTKLLTEIESKNWLRKAGISVNPTFLAEDLKNALSIAKEIGFPVVMKIASGDIGHKSDVGGVKLGLANASQVRKAYHEMMLAVKTLRPDAVIEGVSIQNMARPGVELIVGMNQDSQFGPVIMFGLGGILVEVLKDISFRLVPVTARDASEMIREIRGLALLRGYRGQEAVNLKLLEKLLVDLSQFVESNPQIQELDLNPVYGYKDAILAVDARIITR
jgi:acyl-CoA synthetase (NDP forming)